MPAPQLIALLLGVHAAPSQVAVQSQASDPCALQTRVPQSIKKLLPGLSVVEGQLPTTEERWQLMLETGSLSVEMKVIDGRGEAVLSRDIPLDLRACAAVSDGVALILERYLSDLGWVASAPALGDATIPDEPPSQPVETSTRSSEAPSPEGDQGPDARLFLGLAFEGESGSPFQLRPGGAVEARLGLGDTVELSGLFGVLVPHSREILPGGAGSIEVAGWRGELGVALCFAGLAGRLCPGLSGGLEGISAEAVGTGIFRPASASGRVLRGAADFRYVFAFNDVFGLSATLSALLRGQESRLTVEGAQEDYPIPAFALSFRLGLLVRIF